MGVYMLPGVETLMAADLPQLAAHDMWSEDQGVAAAQALLAHQSSMILADDAALGCQKISPAPANS